MSNRKTKTRVALNGFGRIGRAFFKQVWDDPEIEIAAVNTRSSVGQYAHLLKYDSFYGIWDQEVKASGKNLVVNGKKVPFTAEENGGGLPWKKYAVDLVVDATGKRRKKKEAEYHVTSGAGFVVVTSPMDDPDLTAVYKINHENFNPKKHKVIAAASCTTVASALTAKVLDEKFGVEQGMITTIHALTGSQGVIDSAHDDYRKGRAATESIVPTTTGAAKTIGKLFPHLEGKLSAMSIRVPIALPSLISFALNLKKPASVKSINSAFRKAAHGELKGSLDATDLPLVSVDYIQNPHGATIDLLSTSVVNGKIVTVLAWYDNEWGYTAQTVKLIKNMAKKINGAP